MSEHVSAVAQASVDGVISHDQVVKAICKLPCYKDSALRPGGYNHRYYELGEDPCDQSRGSVGYELVIGVHPPIPNKDGILSGICLACPVFAPAAAELASVLPIS